MKTSLPSCPQCFLLGALAIGLQLSHATAKDQTQEEFHKTYALNSDGQFRLDNVNGKIHITTWDRQEAQVDAVKRASTQEDLEATKIEVDSKAGRLTIHTKYPKSKGGFWGKSHSTSVDYEIKVPSTVHLDAVENVNGSVVVEGVRGSVHASTVNGRLAASGLAADAKLESVNGTVDAAFTALNGVKSISLSAVNGKLNLVLPANADAEVKAESLNGRIEADKLTVKKNWPVGSELRGTLGQGGTRVKAETVNGGIRVKLAGPGERPMAEQPDKS